MEVPTLPYAALQDAPGARFVDLRSPAEHAVDCVPGAANVPLFDDDQRAVVGTLYRQVSPERAMEHGLGEVERRLPALLSAILGREVPRSEWEERFRRLAAALRRRGPGARELAPAAMPADPLVLYCWRGGMRSRSVTALLQELGEERVVHLTEGYKGYRRHVRERLAAFDPATPLILLRGPTGVGKTLILKRLEEARPGSTIDLEGLAQHRSSILGDVGREPVGQRAFESRLAARLTALGPPPWFVEGESRKVGDRIIPEPFFRAMESGVQVRIDASLAHRIRVLGDDYLSAPGNISQLAERLPFLEKRLGRSWVGRLQEWLAAGDWRGVATVLLERYYDVRYARSDRRRSWAARLSAEEPSLVEQLLELRASSLLAVARP